MRIYNNMPFTKCVPFVLIFLTCVACPGGTETKKNDAEVPERDGSEVVITSPAYTDLQPDFSADGQRLIYLSGRHFAEVDSASSLRVHKTVWPTGGQPSKPMRLTAKDTTIEREISAAISPSGEWIVIVGYANSQTDLWLHHFEDGTVVQLTDDADIESMPQFSDDSNMMIWTNTVPGGGVSYYIADLTTLPTKPSPKLLSQESDKWNTVSWGEPGGGTYNVIASSGLELVKVSFTSADDIQNATREAWAEAPTGAMPESMVFDAGHLGYVAGRRGFEDGLKAVQAGNYKPTTEDGAEVEPAFELVQSIVGIKNLANQKTWVMDKPSGFKVHQVRLNQNGNTALWLENAMYQCGTSKTKLYTRSLVFSAFDDQTSLQATRIVPHLTSDRKSWEIKSEFCDLDLEDELPARIDGQIFDVAFAKYSSTTQMRLAYVSKYSTAFDGKCNLKIGDMDVILVEKVNDVYKVHETLKNRAPIENSERSGEPCVL